MAVFRGFRIQPPSSKCLYIFSTFISVAYVIPYKAILKIIKTKKRFLVKYNFITISFFVSFNYTGYNFVFIWNPPHMGFIWPWFLHTYVNVHDARIRHVLQEYFIYNYFFNALSSPSLDPTWYAYRQYKHGKLEHSKTLRVQTTSIRLLETVTCRFLKILDWEICKRIFFVFFFFYFFLVSQLFESFFRHYFPLFLTIVYCLANLLFIRSSASFFIPSNYRF